MLSVNTSKNLNLKRLSIDIVLSDLNEQADIQPKYGHPENLATTICCNVTLPCLLRMNSTSSLVIWIGSVFSDPTIKCNFHADITEISSRVVFLAMQAW